MTNPDPRDGAPIGLIYVFFAATAAQLPGGGTNHDDSR
jgi:hypothetical protein